MVEWKKYTPNCHPTKTGRYLTLYADMTKEVFPCIDFYFKKGDLMYTKNSNKDTIVERLYDSLFNPELEVNANESGFYELDEEYSHRIMPDFWAECPEPPEGYHYEHKKAMMWSEEE